MERRRRSQAGRLNMQQEPAPAVDTRQTDSTGAISVEQLACTLSSMISPFALFLVFVEKQRSALRRYSVYSVALSVLHAGFATMLVLIDAVFGGIPFLGFLLNLSLWIMYLAAAVGLIVLRVRMMLSAWNGSPFHFPLIGERLERFC